MELQIVTSYFFPFSGNQEPDESELKSDFEHVNETNKSPVIMEVSDKPDSKKFNCCACDQKLGSDFQLKVHYKIGNGIPMQCSKCNFKACTPKGLQIHYKKCHKDNGVENDETKPFKCTELTDASPQISIKVEHVTSKLGEDEFNESEFGKLCTEMVFYLMQKENKALVKI